jgi:ABC-type branched-subunit amino acid transport system substrate-binding protein
MLVTRFIAAIALIGLLAACPQHTRHTLGADVPQTGDGAARHRFVEARAAFLRDGSEAGVFKQIVDEYPEDPIVPWAELYAGIAAVKARDWDTAGRQLDHAIRANADPGLTARATLFLGIAKNYQGDAAGALPLLRASGKAVEGDDERTEYLAALAFATAASHEPIAALPIFDELWGRATPTERAVILARIEEVVAGAEPAAVKAAYDATADHKGPTAAIAGTRLVLLADDVGSTDEAARLRETVEPARAAVGLPAHVAADVAPASGGNGGQGGLVGAVMPLGGKQNRVAEAAIAGLGLAAGAADGSGVAAIEVRTAGDATTAAAAIDDLAGGNVIAIVGPIDGASVDAAGSRAEGLGVPLLSLSPRPEGRTTGTYVFHVMHSAEVRARALATRARALGITRFAVLAPDSAYGKAVSAAFADEVEHGGGKIIQKQTYKPDTKSFASIAKSLDTSWQAIFIPEQADRLGLIVPALAAAGAIPKPVGTKKAIGGRPVLLLSTAEGLSASYLTDAGRHSEGALFAPGYFPEDQDPTSKAFVDRFVAAYGRAPGAVEAYAYDAAQLAAAGGAGGRAGLAAALANGELVGLTGTIRFDAEHHRADNGVIYTVVEDAGQYVVRIAR